MTIFAFLVVVKLLMCIGHYLKFMYVATQLGCCHTPDLYPRLIQFHSKASIYLPKDIDAGLDMPDY